MLNRGIPPRIPFNRYQCDRNFKIKIVLYKKVTYLHVCHTVLCEYCILQSQNNQYLNCSTVISAAGPNRQSLSPTVRAAQMVYSPTRTKRQIDTSLSMRRYSLFGPNVAPVWEYYTEVPGRYFILQELTSQLEFNFCNILFMVTALSLNTMFY